MTASDFLSAGILLISSQLTFVTTSLSVLESKSASDLPAFKASFSCLCLLKNKDKN